jgi:3',5'-cyclic AMP phosphodiesterase CpdA
MIRIVHISDLHFGTEQPDLVAALEAQIKALAPDLVAASGDLTQRARPRELAAAAAFIGRLPRPVLAVPGNHDIPGVTPARFVDPWRGWLRHFPDGLEPEIEGPGFVAVGANSVRSGGPYLDWSRGRLGEAQITRLAARLAAATGRLRILVAHHPLLLTPAGAHRGLVGRGPLALAKLGRAGLDLALGGHVHLGYAGIAGGVVIAHAGTGVSDRLVGEGNGFNVITGDHETLTVEHWRWQGRAYAPDDAAVFRRLRAGWQAITP